MNQLAVLSGTGLGDVHMFNVSDHIVKILNLLRIERLEHLCVKLGARLTMVLI